MAIIPFFNISVCAELAALAAALYLLQLKAAGYWRLFTVFLIVTIFVEFAGYYYRYELKTANYPVYNFLMLLQAGFFGWLFYRFHSVRVLQLLVLVFLAVFLLFFFAEGIYHSFGSYHKYSRQFLSFCVVLYSCTYYFTLVKNDAVKTPLRHPSFWIVTGLFFYYFGSIAMFAFFDKVSAIKLAGNISFYTLVIGSLSCILYGCWIIGFIWKHKQLQSSTPLL